MKKRCHLSKLVKLSTYFLILCRYYYWKLTSFHQNLNKISVSDKPANCMYQPDPQTDALKCQVISGIWRGQLEGTITTLITGVWVVPGGGPRASEPSLYYTVLWSPLFFVIYHYDLFLSQEKNPLMWNVNGVKFCKCPYSS